MHQHRPARLKRLALATALCFYFSLGKAQIQISGDDQNKTVTGSLQQDATVSAGQSVRLLPGFYSSGKAFRGFLQNVAPNTCFTLTVTPNSNQNYIWTLTPRSPFTDPNILNGKKVCDVNQEVQYFDGLGRPLQTVMALANPTATRDMIQPVEYDALDREAKKYLPYTVASTPGTLRSAAFTEQSGFYNPPGSTGTQLAEGHAHILTPFSQTVFEPSPLNRVDQQGFPGDAWQPTNPDAGLNHTVRTEYAANTDTQGPYAVKLYRAESGNPDYKRLLVSPGAYGPGELYITITKDENFDKNEGSRAGIKEEYKDKEGKVVMKRTYNREPDNSVSILSTYYVYDDQGNLSFVLPPMTNADNNIPAQTVLDNLCYQYRYDERQRLIEKKLPGKDWEYMIYNKLDQVVLTQDANQRSTGIWICTKYDGLGRVVMTGTYHYATSRDVVQELFTNYAGALWETYTGTGPMHGYNNASAPGDYSLVYSINYYDTYDIPGLPQTYDKRSLFSPMTHGLLTATKVAVLNDPNQLLWTVNYYDEEGRMAKQFAQHFKGGGTANLNNYDEITNAYNFTDQLTSSKKDHYVDLNNAKNLALSITDSYTYDHMGRKVDTYQQIGSQPQTLIARLEYNEIGQLKDRQLHKEASMNNFLVKVDYTYNERGWTSAINTPLAGLSLKYNDGTVPQYNGNIANQTWGQPGTIQGTYDYRYDKLNRLKSGISNTGNDEKDILYDLHGNIKSLTRNTSTLQYTYDAMSNRLNSVSGLVNGGFTYDANGNMIADGTRGSTIAYNYLNLPVTYTGTKSASYVYDVMGKKLRSTTDDGTWDYVGNIQYKDGTLSFVQNEEGRARNINGTYKYEYSIKDWLGNSRVMIDKDNQTGQVRVIQNQDYYPFGLEHPGNYVFGAKNRYLYNGKELQAGLNIYDYGARFYDPVIAKWTTVDPLAEKYEMNTPYSYVSNNPLRFIDPDGMGEEDNAFGKAMDLQRIVNQRKHMEAVQAAVTIGSDIDAISRGDIGSVSSGNAAYDFGDESQDGSKPKPRKNGSKTLTHKEELEKYGEIMFAGSISLNVSLIEGVAIEKGVVSTNKRWSRNYTTYYLNYGWSGGIGMNFGPIISKNGYKATFSDFAGESINGVGISYAFMGLGIGHSSKYTAPTMTLGLGYGIKNSNFNGSLSPVSITVFDGPAYYVPHRKTDFTNSYIQNHGQH